MLKIRLQRTGRKHEATYRLVVTDSKNSTKSGRAVEIVGAHDPRRDNMTVLNGDRIKHWISMGAGLSGTVHNLLVTHKIIDAKKINVLPKKTVAKKEEPVVEVAPAPAPVEEAPAVVEEVATPAVEETPVVEEAPAPAPEVVADADPVEAAPVAEDVVAPAEEKTEEATA
jgi:small subunit ribosomal protein S16